MLLYIRAGVDEAGRKSYLSLLMDTARKNFDAESFKQRLDACHAWPCTYTFKFIVPLASRSETRTKLEETLEDVRLSERPSSRGNYVSITAEAIMGSAEEVMLVYERVSVVSGLMAL
jgi:hypothetical protein